MIDGFEQLTLGGIVAILVLREVLGFLRDHRNNKHNQKNNSKMHEQVHDLWAWHDVRDDNGVPLWYTKRSLETSVLALVDEIRTLNLLMREDMKDGRALHHDIKELLGKS